MGDSFLALPAGPDTTLLLLCVLFLLLEAIECESSLDKVELEGESRERVAVERDVEVRLRRREGSADAGIPAREQKGCSRVKGKSRDSRVPSSISS